MRRADRLFQIVQLLRGGRHTTAGKLAEALEVSERTIYRDIADLQGSGVPIEGEAGFGYLMAEGFTLPPLMFTEDEIVALVVGARLVRAWGGAAMARGAEEALIKIASVLPEGPKARAEAVKVHAMAHEMTPDIAARLDAIEAAIDGKRRLDLRYRDGEGQDSSRVVRPLGLFFWGKIWMLVAWCELRDDFRAFRLDRISGMQSLDGFKPERAKSLETFLAQVSATRGESHH